MCYLILLFNTWNENIVIIQLSCRKSANILLQIRSQVVLTLVICYTIIQLIVTRWFTQVLCNHDITRGFMTQVCSILNTRQCTNAWFLYRYWSNHWPYIEFSIYLLGIIISKYSATHWVFYSRRYCDHHIFTTYLSRISTKKLSITTNF